MRISIFGLGYVGAVSFGCLARDGHEVVGVDIDRGKLELLSSGQTPIIEKGMQELIEGAAASGRTSVTEDTDEAIRRTDVSFVCVGTPSAATGEHDLTALMGVAKSIGQALGEKQAKHTVVVRSTIAPGITEDVLIPILEQTSGKVCGTGFDVCFQPEFLREGASIQDYNNPPFTVVGCRNDTAAAPLRQIFGHLDCPIVEVTIKTAEMLKFCCNVFHALKIDFANEVGRVCDGLGIDSRSVMELLCMDRQLNISTAYLKPGLPFGGSCLPKDVRAMVRMAQESAADIPVIAGIMPSNKSQTEYILEKIIRTGKRKVAFLGLSFKSGTDDLRESPLVELVERLIGKGLDIRIFDPEVSIARLVGANKRYIEEAIPHVSRLMRESIADTIRSADVIIVGQLGVEIEADFYATVSADQHVIDLTGKVTPDGLAGSLEGSVW